MDHARAALTQPLYIYIFVCVCVSLSIYIYIYICACLFVYIYICVCMYRVGVNPLTRNLHPTPMCILCLFSYFVTGAHGPRPRGSYTAGGRVFFFGRVGTDVGSFGCRCGGLRRASAGGVRRGPVGTFGTIFPSQTSGATAPPNRRWELTTIAKDVKRSTPTQQPTIPWPSLLQ